MNWFRKSKPVPEVNVKSSAPVKLSWANTANMVVSTARQTNGNCAPQAGYLHNVVGFRCVRLIAESAAAVPVVNAWECPILEAPNAHQSCQEFLEDLYGWLQIAGNAYVVRSGDTLSLLHPERVKVICDATGWTTAYDYRVNSKVHRYPADSVLHVASFNPVDEVYGASPLQTAMTAIGVHSAAGKWSKALLDNAARPSGAIVYDAPDNATLTTEQFDRLVEELEVNHQGAANAGRPMLLEGGLDWKPMGFSPSDMEFMQTKNAAARDIALAFGVPPMLLGLPGDNTYANYQEANKAFTRQTILPLVQKVLGALARFLEVQTPLKPDLDQLTALSDERDAFWKRVAGADFLSDAEKRVLLGFGE